MGAGYYHTTESVSEYIKMAEGYNGKHLIEKLEEYLPEGEKILEIGSGPGSDYEILVKIYEVQGSDYSLEFVKYLETKFEGDKFLNLDARTLDVDSKFNGIYSNKVFQHLVDEEFQQSLNKQHFLLEDGGIICHSLWKGEGDEIFKDMLVNYQNEESLQKLLYGKFEFLLIESYAEFEENDSIFFIAKKI